MVIVIVERQWIVDVFPETELLDLFAYAYGALSVILQEAHVLCGHRMLTQMRSGETFDSGYAGNRLPCMIAPEESRSAAISLATGDLLAIDRTPVEPLENAESRLTNRYGTIRRRKAQLPLFELGEHFFDQAKRVLSVDGYHRPIVMLFGPRGQQVIMVDYPDQAAKYFSWRAVADEVARSGATGLIFVTEAWGASQDPARATQRASERDDRYEILVLSAAKASGDTRTWEAVFHRDEAGKITFDDTSVQDNAFLHFLEPVYRVWPGDQAHKR